MSRGRGRGAYNNNHNRSNNVRRSQRNSSQDLPHISENHEVDLDHSTNKVYCFYCPVNRPAMSAKTLLDATFCTNCNAAFHPGCIKRCQINEDGSIQECCGPTDEDMYNSTTNINIHQQEHSLEESSLDLSNIQLKNFIGEKIDNLAKNLEQFNNRIKKMKVKFLKLNHLSLLLILN